MDGVSSFEHSCCRAERAHLRAVPCVITSMVFLLDQRHQERRDLDGVALVLLDRPFSPFA
jgi:hypothetical protein